MHSRILSKCARAPADSRGSVAAVLAILPLAAAIPPSVHAAILSVQDFSISGYNSSGYFTDLDAEGAGSSLGAQALGDGLRLFGQAFMSDDKRTDSTTGLALLWSGEVVGGSADGDLLALDFELAVTFTDNVSAGTAAGVELQAGFADSPIPRPSSGDWLPSGLGADFWGRSLVPGVTDLAGTLKTYPVDAMDPAYWYVLLTVHWADFDDSGDVLSIDIPKDSIDIGIGEVPVAATPVPSSLALMAGGLLVGARLRRRP